MLRILRYTATAGRIYVEAAVSIGVWQRICDGSGCQALCPKARTHRRSRPSDFTPNSSAVLPSPLHEPPTGVPGSIASVPRSPTDPSSNSRRMTCAAGRLTKFLPRPTSFAGIRCPFPPSPATSSTASSPWPATATRQAKPGARCTSMPPTKACLAVSFPMPTGSCWSCPSWASCASSPSWAFWKWRRVRSAFFPAA